MHSIREILNLVKTVDEELATELLPAAALTPYGVEVHCPGRSVTQSWIA